MNSIQLFTLALNLPAPWIIKEIKLEHDELSKRGTLIIDIDFIKGSKFTDENGVDCSAYDTEHRKWQHLNFFEHTCVINARVPRIKQSTGEVRTVATPWARTGSSFTLLFEAYAMLLIESEMPVSKVAGALRVVSNRLWRMFNFWVGDALSKDNLSEVKQIGIDETSSKKGHNYVTVCVDLEKRRVIHVSEGKDSQAVTELASSIKTKHGNVAAISHVAIDMSPSFIAGVGDNFPNAKIVFDKFHIFAMLNKAMDELRKGERIEFDLLKGHKYTVLYKYEKLTEKKQQELDYLLHSFPRLGEGYRLKEMFSMFWELKEPEAAISYLTFWCDMVMETDIIPFKKFVKTLRAHWSGVINYITTKINSGVMEGINTKIQLAKRRARGYRNINNFMNMIYFIAGKLKFNYPHYPL